MPDPIYAIGDIHGQIDMLHAALARIEVDGGPDAQVIFLGDYTDRGPDSRAVLELLIQGQRQGRNWICLRGNHDQIAAMFLEDYPRSDARFLVGYHWLHPRIGGIETLRSYGVDVPEGDRVYKVHQRAKAAIPQHHIEFLSNLPRYHLHDDLLFVHAGIQPGVPLNDQDPEDLIWIRGEFLNDKTQHPWLVVHGHSHVATPEHHGNRVNLDTGAAYGHTLTAAVFEGAKCWVLEEDGRRLLTP